MELIVSDAGIEVIDPDQDKQGRFTKGNKKHKGMKAGDGLPVPNPVHLGRDIHGRPLPGFGHLLQRLPERVMRLKVAMTEAVSEEQIVEVVQELRNLCLKDDPKIQIPAMALFFDRVLGKSAQEVMVQRNTTQTKTIKHDFSKLPTEELKQLQGLLEKAGSPEIVIDAKD